MAPATVKLYLESLSAVFKACRKEYRWTQYNPVRDVTMPKLPKGRDRYLTDAERTSLLAECEKGSESRLYAFVLLAISTGARASELTGLTWGDVDLERGVATLRKTKNGDMRALPVKGAALAAIKAMRPEDAPPALHVFAGLAGPIFDYAKPFNAARDATGIKNFRFHDCRHSTASYLAMNGATASEIAAVLGHRTLQMVKRYAHLSDGHVGTVIERMNDKRKFADVELLQAVDPCFQCPWSAACVRQETACIAFAAFVNGEALGRKRKLDYLPNAELFKSIFEKN